MKTLLQKFLKNYWGYVLLMLILLSVASAHAQTQDSSWYNSGADLFRKNQFEFAKYDFDKSIKAKVEVAKSYSYKALCEIYLKEYAEADADLAMAYQSDPLESVVYLIKARSFCVYKKNPDSLMYWAKKAFAADAHNITYTHYDVMAMAYMQKGNYDSAISMEKKALRLDSSDIFFSNLGYIQQHFKHYKEAVANYKQSLKRNWNAPTVWLDYAFCNYKLKNYKEALGTCNDILEQFGDAAFIYCVRSQVYTAMGDKKAAEKDFAKVAELTNADKADPSKSNNASLSDYGCDLSSKGH